MSENMIEHRILEHSVVPVIVEQMFGLSPITVRDQGLVGLQALATLKSPRTDAPLRLPAVAASTEPIVNAVAESSPLLSAVKDD